MNNTSSVLTEDLLHAAAKAYGDAILTARAEEVRHGNKTCSIRKLKDRQKIVRRIAVCAAAVFIIAGSFFAVNASVRKRFVSWISSFMDRSSGIENEIEPAEPPVRLGAVSDASASLERTYSLTSAFDLADAVAVVEIKSWLFEDKEMHETFYSAATDRCYKGELPESFTLAQNGCSEITYVDYPLFTVGNKLLLFLNYAENTEYGNLYWIRGSYTTVMDVVLSDSGEEYIADRFGVTGYETRYETKDIDNYAGVKEVYDLSLIHI